ncbi:MAG TPA: hypothetical protein VI542_34925 [Candidatus Tectomicrobia bacterium]
MKRKGNILRRLRNWLWPTPLFACHAPQAVRCPRCRRDVTDVYQRAPWYRHVTWSMTATDAGREEREAFGLQQCSHCNEVWAVNIQK